MRKASTSAKRATLFLLVVLALATYGVAQAQTGGQVWVRAFEDRNGNGQRDSGEPLLTRGVGVELLNADGIVIASALLDSSPNAAQGLVGFQQLPAGQYTLIVTGPEFKPTTQSKFTMTVSDSGVPAVLEFGGQRLALTSTQTTAASAPLGQQTQLIQVGLSALGAALVIVFMIVVGLFIYFAVLRGRMAKAKLADARTTGTGQLRQVRSTSTGEIKAVK